MGVTPHPPHPHKGHPWSYYKNIYCIEIPCNSKKVVDVSFLTNTMKFMYDICFL